MKLKITRNFEESSRFVADHFAEIIVKKPDALLGFSTGSSTMGLYQCLVSDYQAGLLDFSRIRTVNLDEYAGLPQSHHQSFAYYMNRHLFSHINLAQGNIFLVDGAKDPEAEVCRWNIFLAGSHMDIVVLGVGTNGHIGFNEPGRVFHSKAYLTTLLDETIDANARFFHRREDVPTKAFTMGVADVLRADKALLIASGKNKAEAIRRLFENDLIDPMLPCSILKGCRNAVVVVDEELAAEAGLGGDSGV